jgi:hypothetical protein
MTVANFTPAASLRQAVGLINQAMRHSRSLPPATRVEQTQLLARAVVLIDEVEKGVKKS